MKLTTSKFLYNAQEEAVYIEDLKRLGFTFEDYGNGLLQIFGEPEIELHKIGEIRSWMEVIVGPNGAQLLDWQSTRQLLGE